jgi:hypothetical protein
MRVAEALAPIKAPLLVILLLLDPRAIQSILLDTHVMQKIDVPSE